MYRCRIGTLMIPPLNNLPATALLECSRRRCLFKSVAKASIAPERARRNVDIPRFPSRPISARGAFATDLDTPLPRNALGAPRALLLSRPRPSAPSCRSAPPTRRSDVRARARVRSRAIASPARWSAGGRRPILPCRERTTRPGGGFMGYKSGWLAVSATVPRLDLLKHPEGGPRAAANALKMLLPGWRLTGRTVGTVS